MATKLRRLLNETSCHGAWPLLCRAPRFYLSFILVLPLQNSPIPNPNSTFSPSVPGLCLRHQCSRLFPPTLSLPHHPCHYIPLPMSPGGQKEGEVLIRWKRRSSRGTRDGTLTHSRNLRHPDPAEECGDRGGEPHLTHSLEALALRPRHGSQISPSCLCQCYSTDSHQQQ